MGWSIEKISTWKLQVDFIVCSWQVGHLSRSSLILKRIGISLSPHKCALFTIEMLKNLCLNERVKLPASNYETNFKASTSAINIYLRQCPKWNVRDCRFLHSFISDTYCVKNMLLCHCINLYGPPKIITDS